MEIQGVEMLTLTGGLCCVGFKIRIRVVAGVLDVWRRVRILPPTIYQRVVRGNKKVTQYETVRCGHEFCRPWTGE
jgi:hypothetical protein